MPEPAEPVVVQICRTADVAGRYPWESEEDRATRRILARRIPDVRFDDDEFEDVIEDVRAFTGLTIVPNWTALEASAVEKDAVVTLRAHDIRVDVLIDLALEEVGAGATELVMRVSKGIVHISTREDLSRTTFVAVYDCSDFLLIEEEHLAKYIDRVLKAVRKYTYYDRHREAQAIERIVRSVIRDSRRELLTELVRTIRNAVDPESWRAAGGNVGTIECVGTKLVVSQTVEAHRSIFDLLCALRAKDARRAPSGVWP